MAGTTGFRLLLLWLLLRLRGWWVFRLRHRFGQGFRLGRRFRLRLLLLLPPCWLRLLWLTWCWLRLGLLLLLLLWGFRLGVWFRLLLWLGLLRLGRHRALLRGCGVILAGNA